MTKDSSAAAVGRSRRAGNKAKAFALRVFGDWIVDHFKSLLTALAAPLGYAALAAFGIAPTPDEIVSGRYQHHQQDPNADVDRPLGIGSVHFRDDGSAAGKLGSALQLDVITKLRSVNAALSGLRIDYGLTNLRASYGSANAVDLRWALKVTGSQWKRCAQQGVRYTSRPDLTLRIARAINNSLQATETEGRPTCS